MSSKFFNKPFDFLLCKTNKLHFSVHVCCNRSQKTSQSVKNNSHTTWLCLVSYFLFFTHGDIICDLLQYTHTWGNVIYLLNNCTLVLCEKSVVQFDSARHNRFLWTNCFFLLINGPMWNIDCTGHQEINCLDIIPDTVTRLFSLLKLVFTCNMIWQSVSLELALMPTQYILILIGIGLAHICLASGYKCVIFMPDTQSKVWLTHLQLVCRSNFLKN